MQKKKRNEFNMKSKCAYHDHYLKKDILANVFEKFIDTCLNIAGKYEIKVGDVKKLIPNLGNKTNYVLHYKNHQLYLSLGMKLTKVHRMLKFKQSDLMKKYINFNIRKKNKCC